MPSNAPAIVLVNPQMGENIGATARAMMNFGLTDLRLVKPRDGWPNERAKATASGALDIMPAPTVYETFEDSIHDLHFVLATTSRDRDMVKPVYTPARASEVISARTNKEQNPLLSLGVNVRASRMRTYPSVRASSIYLPMMSSHPLIWLRPFY